MPYKSTRDMVQRVMPLIEQLATTRIDKARLVQYLAASSAVDWGVMSVVSDEETEDGRMLIYRDEFSGEEHELRYPDVLPHEIEPLVLAEYKRLAVDKPLTRMDLDLFRYLYDSDFCSRCRYRTDEYTQFHNECFFAGYPVNFEAVERG